MSAQVIPISLILFHRIVPLFPEVSLQEASRQSRRSLTFPDGSRLFEFADKAEATEAYADLPISTLALQGQVERTVLRNLAGFSPMVYDIYYGAEYSRKFIDKEMFHAGVGPAPKIWPGEYQLEDLLFTIWFLRTPTKNHRDALLTWFGNWLHTVSVAGLWGEGRISSVTSNMVFRGKRADVRLNASRTGPRTLIWLVLSALEFGHSVATITSAVFNYDDPAARQSMIEISRKLAASTGDAFTEQDERHWLDMMQGGRGQPIVLPLPTFKEE